MKRARLRRFWTYLRPFRRSIVLLFGSILATILINLPTPWLEKLIIDEAIPQGDLHQLFILVAGILLLFTTYRVVLYARSLLSVSVKQRVLTGVRMHMYEHLQRMSLQFFAKHRSGSLLSRITTDVSYVQNLMNDELFEVISSAIKVVVVIGLLVAISAKLTLLCTAVLPVITLLFLLFRKRVYDQSKALQQSQAELSGTIQQNFSGMKLIQAEGIEEQVREQTLATSRQLERVGVRRERVAHTGNLLTMVLTYVPIMGILWGVGGVMVVEKTLTLGELLAYTQYLFGIVTPVTRFFQFNMNLQAGYAALDRIYEVLDEEPDIVDAPEAIELAEPIDAIELDGVSLRFGSDEATAIQALDSVSFRIAQGEKIAIVGPSGGGKSSVANLLLRFYEPTVGRVLVNGRGIQEYRLQSLRERIAYVSQDVFLFNDTVRHNVTLGRPAGARSTDEALELAQAAQFVAGLDGELDAAIDEQGANLSGGQRQRLALARALRKDASLYILDEATSALDAASERQVIAALAEVLQERTAIIVAHRFTFPELVDRVLVFADGRLVEEGTVPELLEQKGMFHALYQLQQ